MSRRLVVTGDDVGLHPAITDGVVAAHDRGVITACSVVAAGADLARTATLLRERPRLEPGLHLVLAGGPLVSRPDQAPSLFRQGVPYPGWPSFVAAYLRGRVDLADVERELSGQLDRLAAFGLRPTHLNGHQHLHVLPGIAAIVARFAREAGVAYVRAPAGLVRRELRRPALIALDVLARRARRRAGAAGLATCERAIGLVHAGHLTAARILAELAGPGAIIECVAHPGTDDGALGAALGWDYAWRGELEALTHADLPAALAVRHVELARPSELAQAARRAR